MRGRSSTINSHNWCTDLHHVHMQGNSRYTVKSEFLVIMQSTVNRQGKYIHMLQEEYLCGFTVTSNACSSVILYQIFLYKSYMS